jgi:putative selenium metabolism protein SsnA
MLLIGNGNVVTRDGARPLIANGAVAIDGGRIVKVGSYEALKAQYPDAQFIDARGGVIMPGMINAHNHIYSAFARGMAIKGYSAKGFLEILDGLWWTLDRHLKNPDTRLSADMTFVDCIENGVTTVIDHHASYGEIAGSLFQIADSAKEMGVRACLCYEVSDRDGQDKMTEGVKENEAFIKFAQKDETGRIAALFGLHAPFTLSNKTLETCAAHNPGAGYHIHVAEGIDDVHLSLRRHGKRPAFRLHDFGILGEKTLLGHCTHVSEAEIDLIAETGSMVGHNPESNMGNAIGCPPVLNMFHKGVLIGLGTDGYTNDMLESYKVGNLLHKHNLADPSVAWTEIPAMLFENNARMASKMFGREIGVLKEGAAADVIVLDYIPPTPLTEGNINGHVMFGMNGRMVTATVADGKVLMKDRQLTNVDKPGLYARCREAAAALWARINEGR